MTDYKKTFTQMGLFKISPEIMKRTIETLHPDGDLFEIRLIHGKKWNASGYFTNADTAIEAFQKFTPASYRQNDARKATIYITLNRVDMACYSREQHDKFVEGVRTTGDSEISRLHWLLIDLDPNRIAGISSTDSELQKAFDKAKEIKKFLSEHSWKLPISGMSGNGAHLLYRFDVPNTPENKSLWEETLKALDSKFSDNTVKVDITTFNQSRICKLYGTIAQKGANTQERPHRAAYIIESTPETIEVNDISVMKDLISEITETNSGGENKSGNGAIEPEVTTGKKKIVPVNSSNAQKSNEYVKSFIDKYNIPLKEIKEEPDKTLYILEHCLFDESHSGKDAAIVVQSDGTIGYHCFHDHCTAKTWKDVRLLYEPEAYNETTKKKYISPYDADGTGTLTIKNLKAFMDAQKYGATYDVILRDFSFSGFVGESEEHLKQTVPDLIYDSLQFELRKCSSQKIANLLKVLATRNKVNPIREKIESAVWDGKDRLEEIYHMFQITSDFDKLLFKKWSMQAIAGLYNDNAKNPYSLDIVLVFLGGQGIAKTRFFEHLAMDTRYFSEGTCLDPHNKDSIIEATHSWICELGEIGSTLKKDMDSVKALLTKSADEYRNPYDRAALKYPRRTSFVGTVNDEKYLIDETGNRRFATIRIQEGISLNYDTQIATFDSLQFWAQIHRIVQDELKNGATIAGCFRLTDSEKAMLETQNSQFVKPLKGEQEVIDLIDRYKTINPNQVEWKFTTVTDWIISHPELRKYSSVQIGKVLTKLKIKDVPTKINGSTVHGRTLPFFKVVTIQ